MQTREIPKPSWGNYLQALGNHKAYQPVRVQIEGAELGFQPLVDGLPLVGLSVEAKGSHADAIELTMGAPGKGALTHVIDHPTHVWVEENDDGEVQAIDIEDDARVKTLIFFGPEGSRGPAGG